MSDCSLCDEKASRYDFDRVCCTVRWFMHEPRLEIRRAMFERVKKRRGKEFAHEVSDAVREQFERRKRSYV